MKHTITPKMREAITLASNKLHPPHRTVRRSLTGQQLIDMGYTHIYGQAVDATRHYAVDCEVVPNTAAALTRLAEREGSDMLNALIGHIR